MPVTVNCDMGESYGLYRMGDDAGMMPLIDIANVACGFHASDFNHMRATVRLAKQHGVKVGAHPSLPDLQGFGRRHLACSPDEVTALEPPPQAARAPASRSREARIARRVSGVMSRASGGKARDWIGDPTRQAWIWSEKPGELPAARSHLLTHDPVRYADEQWWRDHRPQLVMGPASWRWVERAYASWRVLDAPGVLEAVDVPVLIISTASDKLVSHAANLKAAKRLPKGEMVAFGSEAHHEVLREVDAVRNPLMAAIATFLDRVTAPKALA